MELSENSDHSYMNDNSGNRDREDGVSRTDILEKNGSLKDTDLSLNVTHNHLNPCAENFVHLSLENKSKKREYSCEMEPDGEETSHKVIKLSDSSESNDTSNDSKVDVQGSASKTNDTDAGERKDEETSPSSIDGCAQVTTDDAILGNLIPEIVNVSSEPADLEVENESDTSTSCSKKSSEDKSTSNLSKSFEKNNSSDSTVEMRDPPTPELDDDSDMSTSNLSKLFEKRNSSNSTEMKRTSIPELSDDSSSEDTSSCDSSSSSSDFMSIFSELEDEDDNFGLVSHEGINSEDEQNSETEDDKLPPVLEKTLPVDKFSFPKEILLRQINCGDGKRRHYYNFENKVYGSRRMVQRLELFKSLKKHNGCVNTLSFNDTGNVLISASDDRHVSLWNWAENKNLLHFNSGHIANVFQAKFLPHSNDRTLITCGQDNQVRKCVLDGCGLKNTSLITKHDRAVHKLAMQPQMPNSFLTAGEDGVVYSIDTRESNTFCSKLLKVHGHRRNSMATICLYSIHCNPVKNFEFIVGGSCEKIRLYDQRNISSKRQNPVKEFRVGCDLSDQEEGMLTTVTCAVYNHNGTEILASYNDNDVFLFNCNDPSRYAFRYDGHRNITTIKGVNFFGPQSEFVVSGSDCGYIYIWDKQSESVVQWMKGDNDIVNCLESHPSFPVLATSGLDSDVKVWMPSSKGCGNITSRKDFQKVVKKNLYLKRNNPSHRDESEVNFFYFLIGSRRT